MYDVKQKLQEAYQDWGTAFDVDGFMFDLTNKLELHGFHRNDSRLVFSVCSDDLNRLSDRITIENALVKHYNSEFHLGTLGAYPIAGVTGLAAASHHVPDMIEHGKSVEGNLIIFASPHVGAVLANSNTYGKVVRPGQERETTCCGAMMGFLKKLKESKSSKELKGNAGDAIDVAKNTLFSEMFGSHSAELDGLLGLKDENKQVIELSKINHLLVVKRIKEIVNVFSHANKFEGKIVLVSGITINTSQEDYFISKEVTILKGKD